MELRPRDRLTQETIGVVGPGRMGVGLSVALTYAGVVVRLIDLKPREPRDASLGRAMADYGDHLGLLQECELLDDAQRAATAARLTTHPSDEAADALAGCTTVIEAVPERLDAKRETFARITDAAPVQALITSTTSTFLVDTLAELVAGPERFMNTHWLNPAYLMPLVEVSPGARTSSEAHQAMMGILRAVGKVPITVSATPGFVVPRLQGLVMNEAIRMWEEGVASAEDLDAAARIGFGLRFAVLGPLEFTDWGGVDTLLHGTRYLREALNAERFEPPAIVAERVADGRVGMSAGAGLHDYSDVDLRAHQLKRTRSFVSMLRHQRLLVRPPDANPPPPPNAARPLPSNGI